MLAEPVDQRVKTVLVLQQRGQVVKKNAWLRVVRHFADQLLQIVHLNVPRSLSLPTYSRSNAGIDYECAFVLRIRSCEFFLHCSDARKAWSALEHRPQFGMLLRRGGSEHFNAAVPQISHVTTYLQLFRGVLREIAETNALDHSRHEVPLGLFCVAHESCKL